MTTLFVVFLLSIGFICGLICGALLNQCDKQPPEQPAEKLRIPLTFDERAEPDRVSSTRKC